MTNVHSTPILDAEDGTLLGFVAQDSNGWVAKLPFGYMMGRATTEGEAETIVRAQAKLMQSGLWQYYDENDGEWYPCILKKVHERRVTVARTNELGYIDVDDDKRVDINDPDETKLVKA